MAAGGGTKSTVAESDSNSESEARKQRAVATSVREAQSHFLLQQKSPLSCVLRQRDARGETALSSAAAGGGPLSLAQEPSEQGDSSAESHADTIELLFRYLVNAASSSA